MDLFSELKRIWSAQWVEWLWNRRVEYWVIRSSVCSFARTAHSFAWSALLASLARSAALIHLFARSFTHSLSHFGADGKKVFVYGLNASISYMQFQLTVHSSELLSSRVLGIRVWRLKRGDLLLIVNGKLVNDRIHQWVDETSIRALRNGIWCPRGNAVHEYASVDW